MKKISVRGVKDPKRRALFKLATREMLKELVSDRMNLELYIEFSNLIDTHFIYGECDWLDNNVKPREFRIRIDDQQPLREQLRTLAHELIHVKQFARNEMYDYLRSPTETRWRGTIVNIEQVKYRKQPWEQEAFKCQTPLLRKFLKKHKINLKDYEDVIICGIQEGEQSQEPADKTCKRTSQASEGEEIRTPFAAQSWLTTSVGEALGKGNYPWGESLLRYSQSEWKLICSRTD